MGIINMKRFLQLLVILLCFTAILCRSDRRRRSGKKTAKIEPTVDEPETSEDVSGEPPNTDHWIDPHNMVDDIPAVPDANCPSAVLSSAFANLQKQLSDCQKQLCTNTSQDPPEELPSSDTPYLKQIVRTVLKATSDINPNTEITLTPENREVLTRFLEDKSNVHDITDILKQSIVDRTLTDYWHENYWMTLEQHFDVGTLILIVVFVCLITTVVVFEMYTCLTVRQQFFYLLIVAFIVSIPWEWCRLYKKEFAKKQSMIMNDIEKHCLTDHKLEITESFRLWWKSSFTFDDSPCKIYQEALLVDPIWEVPPSMAVAVTITRFIVEPFELIADAAGKSFRALFQHLPLQWQPVMFIACIVVIILCLILLSGVRISTPFLQIGVGVDPAIANAGIQRLENQIQELRQQNAAAIEQNGQPGIEDIPPDGYRNAMLAITNIVNGTNERIQQQDQQLQEMRELLQRLMRVADQARQAEAIEHPAGWELVGRNHSGDREERPRIPVQASETHTTDI